MELCWNSWKQVLMRNISCVFFSALGIFLIVLGVYINCVDFNKVGISLTDVFGIGLGSVMVGAAIFYYIEESREYEVDTEGITLRYLRKYYVKHSWNEVTEISVCDVHHATKGSAFEMAIRVVVGNERNGPSNPKCSINPASGYEHWRSDIYDLKHYRQIIMIEYDKNRLVQIREASRKEIKDYRTRRGKTYEIEL